jgi:aldehyde:ferredoxin oxidoreductase
LSKFGYAGTILEVDLSQRHSVKIPSSDYVDRFIGGRGLAAKLYWDKVPPQIKAFDPENSLIFATGPLGGFTRLSGSRWTICGKSPAIDPEFFSYANGGGSWGAWLKFAGYDGMVIRGSSDKLIYLFIHDGVCEIRDASLLRGKNAAEAREMLKAELGKEVRVVATSSAGENLVSFAGVLSDEETIGTSGFGGVMGSKKLKAIAVAGNERPIAAQPERLNELVKYLFKLRATQMRPNKWHHEGRTKRQACWGCIAGCGRQTYRMDNGTQARFFCQVADMYEESAIKYYGSWNETVVHAADLANKHALDSCVLEPMIIWLGKCYQEGILSEEETGLPLSKIGSAEFIDSLVKKICLREGFGDILAQGTIKAAQLVGKGALELIADSVITRGNDLTMYDPRLYIANSLLYATDPRKPIQQLHEIVGLLHYYNKQTETVSETLSAEAIDEIAEKFWGSRAAADYSTSEGKALAARKIQDRTYAKESLILCDMNWPIMVWTSDDGKIRVGDPSVESQIFSAVTGRETDEKGLNRLGERIFNLQRAILLREGWGGRQGDRLMDAFYEIPIQTARFNPDCMVPGKAGEPVSRKGFVVEREKFENLKSDYYELRGWDVPSGLLTSTKLQELELTDLVDDLGKRGFLK